LCYCEFGIGNFILRFAIGKKLILMKDKIENACCTLLNRIPTVQQYDARMLDSSNAGGYIKKLSRKDAMAQS